MIQFTFTGAAIPLLAKGGEEMLHNSSFRSFRIKDRLIPFLELLPVPFHVAPVVQTQFEILCEFEARRRASIFAKTAEHASRKIKYVCGQRFLAFRVTLP